MSLSGEQRPIDVTTLPPRQDHTPSGPAPPTPPWKKSPRQPRKAAPPRRPLGATLRSVAAGLRARMVGVALPTIAGDWLRQPRTQRALLVLAALAAVAAGAARLRPPTVDGPALSRVGWKASASGMGAGRRRPSDPGAALDGNADTRWTTGRGQRNSDWFAVDMGQRQTFHQIVLDTGPNAGEYPRSYAVYVSGDGVHWGASVARGDGQGQNTIAEFKPQTARFIKVVQTGQDRHAPWSLSELTVH